MSKRNIVIRPEVELSVADLIIDKYRKEDEARKDLEGLLGPINSTRFDAKYGSGYRTIYYVYQTKTNIVIGKSFQVYEEEYADTSNPTSV